LRWRRRLVRRRWARFGRRRGAGRPPIALELRALILRLAHENPSRGYQRIRGEVRKLGTPSPRRRSRPCCAEIECAPHHAAPRRAGLAWPAFLRAQAAGLLACDCCVETVRLQTLYARFFLEVH
jgi:putative transposase